MAMTPAEAYRPAQWLRELSRLKRAPWNWGRAIRASVALGVPMAIGLAADRFDLSLLIAMGALGMALSEGDGSYRSRFRQMAIASAIGALGFLAGYLAVLPYPVVILTMTALAFVAGIVNSYGAAYSIGTMLALMYAAIAVGLPAFGPDYWRPAALALVGAGFYGVVLGIAALLDRSRPEREMQAGLVRALAQLARVRAEADEDAIGAARRAVTERSRAFYGALIVARRGGRTHETVAHADFLDAADALFGALMATTDPAMLRAAEEWLTAVADAVAGRGTVTPPPEADPAGRGATQPLPQAMAAFAAATVSDAVASGARHPHAPGPRMPMGELSLPRLTVGRTVLARAAVLALCIGLGFSARYVVEGDHWYWVPMTVAIVMKPELGSVFVRAVLRATGTVFGVLLGKALLLVVPLGYPLVLALAALGALLPWSKNVSYGAQTLIMTPLVLILLDLVSHGAGILDLAGQRLVDTLLGALIALCFGYFIWPRAHGGELARQFDAALAAVADYLVAATSRGEAAGKVIAARRRAYASLSDLRAALNRSMAEPPPAGREAAAWFPLVAASERICDRITAEAPASGSAQWPPPDEVLRVAEELRAVIARAEGRGATAAETGTPTDPFLQAIAAEIAQLAGRVDGAVGPHQTPRGGGQASGGAMPVGVEGADGARRPA